MPQQNNLSGRAFESPAFFGVLAALGAFLIWGSSIVFYKWLKAVPTGEIIAHRVIWSAVFTAFYLVWRGRISEVKAALSNKKTAFTLLLSSFLVSLNWGIFVWAIAQSRVVECALGYFMLPLMSVALGFFMLGEKLNRAQIVAVGLALVAVIAQTIEINILPWVALSLSVTFAFYGFIRKKVDVAASPGLLIEVLLLSLPAIGYVSYLHFTASGHFFTDIWTSFLLVMTGPMTAIPLILYAEAVRRLRMVTVGIIFYINPTVQLLIGVFIYNELVSSFKLMTFALIWIALGIFIFDAVISEKNKSI